MVVQRTGARLTARPLVVEQLGRKALLGGNWLSRDHLIAQSDVLHGTVRESAAVAWLPSSLGKRLRFRPDYMPLPQKLQVASSAGKSAGVNAWKASGNLVDAVGRLVDKAIDRVLLTNERVTSAAEAKRLLAGDADTDALAGEIQRVVVLAMPVVRILARGARLTKVPWVLIASSGVSIGIAV